MIEYTDDKDSLVKSFSYLEYSKTQNKKQLL